MNSYNRLVTVILPTLNESKYIRNTIESFLCQEGESVNFSIEILVVDGGSTDGTKKIVKSIVAIDKRVRCVDNPKRKTPYALNIGITQARGELVLVAGAHSYYASDYVKICLHELDKNKVAGCSGKTVTEAANSSVSACLSAWVVGHRFGTSPNSFRNMKEGYANTLPRAIYRKDALIDVGMYDETLFRNQDNDLNQRLIAGNYKLFYTWKTHSIYYAKDSVLSLLKFSFNNGRWAILTLRKNRQSMYLHHFIPLLFVTVLIVLFSFGLAGKILGFNLALFILAVHMSLGLYFSLFLYRVEKNVLVLFLPPIFLLFHLSYGLGSLSSIFKLIFYPRKVKL
jgi:glycosyltransferase involved in cell wall biosynthesis